MFQGINSVRLKSLKAESLILLFPLNNTAARSPVFKYTGIIPHRFHPMMCHDIYYHIFKFNLQSYASAVCANTQDLRSL